jgi:hypothetical protein
MTRWRADAILAHRLIKTGTLMRDARRPQAGNDRLAINGGVMKPVFHRQTFYASCYRSIIR